MSKESSRAPEIAVKLGKLAFDIAKGAAVGGPHGAAAGAVKGLLPSLVKPVLYILFAMILIPTMIFVSVPSSLFGFENGNAELTSQAEAANQLYKDFSRYVEEEAEALINEYDTADYDEVSISREYEVLSYEWVASICSAYTVQDLELVDGELMRLLARANLDTSTTVDTWEETIEPPSGGGDDSISPVNEEENAEEEESSSGATATVTRRRLNIRVFSIGVFDTMGKLDMDNFAQEWAVSLYDGLCDTQLVPPGSGDIIEDLGDITFQDGEVEVVYYNQRDERWGNLPYGSVDTIAECGCGPTSLAIVISTLTDKTVTPPEMADWSYQKGFYIPYGGSSHALIPKGAKAFGLPVAGAGVGDGQRVADALAEGKLVVAIMGPGHFTTGGHFIVLRGVTAEGRILVADPYSVNYSNREWDFSIILNEAKRSAGAGGPFWIIG